MAEKLRIDKLLAHMGFGTRSEIKRAVKQGKVAVDGKVVKDSGLIVTPDEHTVTYDGETVVYRDVIYLMLNKPQGVISATEDGRERTVIDLLAPEDRLLNPFPVGRLDKDTVGLLLLTNDGGLAHELLSPRKHVDKTYEALVLGNVNEDDVKAFQEGVTLDDGYVTLPAELQVLNRSLSPRPEGSTADSSGDQSSPVHSLIRLTIREGKFHQVKRMFEAVGKKVLTLKRVSMGTLMLDEYLPEGHYRELSGDEVEQLKAHRGSGKK
ncbi:pseudouridine synthase [Paenibacillus sp. NPDC057967]|uniref:pseudouridine synthase n=1 Tax=Paenibacillus sp. NPDC057967 TaxID=3346293 RepID=UPI0036DA75A0